MFFVIIGGFIGAIIRFLISSTWNKQLHPLGTWLANISGSALLGFLVTLRANGTAGDIIWYLLGIGFCGSYTTFSTFGVETLALIQASKVKKAILYVSSSIFFSIASILVIFLLLM